MARPQGRQCLMFHPVSMSHPVSCLRSPPCSPPMASHRIALVPCAAVLQCAPRARTKGRGMLRARQSASKNAPATGADCERFTRIASPFSAKGESLACEGHARSTTFHKPLAAKGLLRKRSPFTSHCCAANTGKVSGYRTPFAHRARGRPVFGSAWPSTLPLLCLGCAHGARTARLLRAKPMAK